MTDYCGLLSVLQSLEIQLHLPAMRNNTEIVGELLHDEFEEVGRSGRRYDKRQTVAALATETEQLQIFAEGFQLTMISEGVALLRYKSFQRDTSGKVVRHTERSSIWLLSSSEKEARWQMRFHQGTAIDD